MEKHSSLDLLLEIALRHLYNIEQQSREDLCRVFNIAGSKKLKALIDRSLLESRLQLQRLDRAFELLDINRNLSTISGLHGLKNILREVYLYAKQKDRVNTSPGIRGILKEGYDILLHCSDAQARDIALLTNEQIVAKFEIAWYRLLLMLAEQNAKLHPIAGLLRSSLKEKEWAYERLYELTAEVCETAV